MNTRLALALLALLPLSALAGVTVTDTAWTYGSSESYPTREACVAAQSMKAPRGTAYVCKTSTRILVTATPPVTPPPVTPPPVVTPPPTSPPTATSDWAARSSAPGVVQALSFRDGVMPQGCGGNFPSAGACYEKGASQAATASSAGVTLYTAGPGGANQAGDLFIKWPQTMGAGKHFYASYGLQLTGFADANGRTPNLDGDGWKISDFFGERPCGDTELTAVNFYYTGVMRAYVNCSNSTDDNFEFPAAGATQQTDTNQSLCTYNNPNASTCIHWTNKLTYLYFDVTFGGSAKSTVKIYKCSAGDGGWRQFISSNHQSIGGAGFNYTDLTNYITGKKDSAPAPAVYTAVYSDWLLSNQPQALPVACL